MSNEVDQHFSSLGTLSAGLLGVVVILVQELVRAKSVDAARLRQSLDAFLAQERSTPGMTEADRRMIDSITKVLNTAFPQEGTDEQGD